MPAASFAAGAELRIAQAIPMQAVTGDYSYDPIFPDSDPDVQLLPDYATLKVSPWSSVPRALPSMTAWNSTASSVSLRHARYSRRWSNVMARKD